MSQNLVVRLVQSNPSLKLHFSDYTTLERIITQNGEIQSTFVALVYLFVVVLSTEYNHPPIKTTEGQFMSSNLIKFFFALQDISQLIQKFNLLNHLFIHQILGIFRQTKLLSLEIIKY